MKNINVICKLKKTEKCYAKGKKFKNQIKNKTICSVNLQIVFVLCKQEKLILIFKNEKQKKNTKKNNHKS